MSKSNRGIGRYSNAHQSNNNQNSIISLGESKYVTGEINSKWVFLKRLLEIEEAHDKKRQSREKQRKSLHQREIPNEIIESVDQGEDPINQVTTSQPFELPGHGSGSLVDNGPRNNINRAYPGHGRPYGEKMESQKIPHESRIKYHSCENDYNQDQPLSWGPHTPNSDGDTADNRFTASEMTPSRRINTPHQLTFDGKSYRCRQIPCTSQTQNEDEIYVKNPSQITNSNEHGSYQTIKHSYNARSYFSSNHTNTSHQNHNHNAHSSYDAAHFGTHLNYEPTTRFSDIRNPSPGLSSHSLTVTNDGGGSVQSMSLEAPKPRPLRLPPILLPRIHTVKPRPMKLLRFPATTEQPGPLTSADWEDLRECRYIRHVTTRKPVRMIKHSY